MDKQLGNVGVQYNSQPLNNCIYNQIYYFDNFRDIQEKGDKRSLRCCICSLCRPPSDNAMIGSAIYHYNGTESRYCGLLSRGESLVSLFKCGHIQQIASCQKRWPTEFGIDYQTILAASKVRTMSRKQNQ